ncbi:MAG: TraM recognition domain-containing protein, partial [Roseibium sp.]|uniref:TraM recognition domain-containing protein n=1 Tax=Roseibium sp. TaxID=1936156 RepID=UPI00329908CF
DGVKEETRLMTAADIGILSGLQGDKLNIHVPRSQALNGHPVEAGDDILSEQHAEKAVGAGLRSLDYMPSVHGTPDQRLHFLRSWLRKSEHAVEIEKHGARVRGLNPDDARVLKQIVWSLGGTAMVFQKSSVKERLKGVDIVIMLDRITELWPQAASCTFPGGENGIAITEVERLEESLPMSCIKTDRDDGLFVMENHVVTHNTELLLGVVSQTLMWSSGFLFVDGKGTTEFYARSWTLAKRFGREDDVRVLNFTDPGGDPDAPAGGPATQSNTVNPFAKGSPDQLMNIVVSLMGDAGSGNDMWKNRAMSLVTAEMKALCELRDSGDILLNVQTIRDFLFLGKGIEKSQLKNKKPTKIEDINEEAWDEMRNRAGLIELYLRALKGEFSTATKLAMKGFFDTLPGFSIEKAMAGDPQDPKCNEQYGFLSMQLTKPLGSLADDYGHIFRTPLGEVDMDDIVLNRRILIVLLPALQKAPEEMQNCGKIVVTMAKIMMGNASGSALQGSRQEIVEAKQTRAPSPYIVVLDEAGYYMVKGIDVMMAQARSLGFMIIVAGQDMAAMQSINAQIAETAAANASIAAVGKTVDGDKTVAFIQKLFGRTQVMMSSGYSSETGIFQNKWVDRMDASMQEVDKVTVEELQHMMEGEFYILFNGTLVKANTFYIGEEFAANFSVNKFLKVRGPMDRVPGLDQAVETYFMQGWRDGQKRLLEIVRDGAPDGIMTSPGDCLNDITKIATTLTKGKKTAPDRTHMAWLAGLIHSSSSAPAPVKEADEEIDDELRDFMNDMDGDEASPFHDQDADIASEFHRNRGDMDLDGIPGPKIGRSKKRSSAADMEGLADVFSDVEAAPPRQRPGRGQAMPIDDLDDLHIGEGLAHMSSAKPRERHRGLVDVLIAQEKAREEVKRSHDLDEFMKLSKPERDRESSNDKESIGEFFTQIARNKKKISLLFVEEEIDGETGIEILRKAGNASPLPLQRVMDPNFLNATLDDLESIIQTD